MELTELMPCLTPPIRTGWYDVERRATTGERLWNAERVFFEKGRGWDHHSCASQLQIWVATDYWRGVKQSKER